MAKRKSGVLLHVTSLPGKEGIGTLGKSAYKFADWLSLSGQSFWQVLPLGPTGYGDSPYASFSTFAGNPLLIDLENLCERGWAQKKEIKNPDYIKTKGPVDYGAVVWFKIPVLYKCAEFFLDNALKKDISAFNSFKKKNAFWLNDFSLFTSIKNFYDAKAAEENVCGMNSTWNNFWPKELAPHNEKALEAWKNEHERDIEKIKVVQFFFYTQWLELKKYCNSKKIKIIGDIPIFVAVDSCDLWANQKYFQFDRKNLKQKTCAGVPPDYFSATGQLWGNPLYNWAALKKDGFDWWVKRISNMSRLVDIIRIDHFRGFESYWSVPYGAENAINGKWVKGPGIALFDEIKKQLGDIEIIAEDLGIITKSVERLRDDAGFPGMKILQFAFGDSDDNAYLPENFSTENCVVYTGTHDNDTTMGFLDSAQKNVKEHIIKKFALKPESNNEILLDALIKAAFMSKAKYCIIPMQDVCKIGSEGRMNMPGTGGKNWTFRISLDMISKKNAEFLKKLTQESRRI